MREFQATAISNNYLRFIITSRKNIFKQLSLTLLQQRRKPYMLAQFNMDFIHPRIGLDWDKLGQDFQETWNDSIGLD